MGTDLPEMTARVAARMRVLAQPGARCAVAVSGGADSLALLDMLHESAHVHGCSLHVLHIDHGLHAESALIGERVRDEARRRNLPFAMRSLEMSAGASETRARELRLTALRELADEAAAAFIVLGHHGDDQAETVLMRLLRGSGPAGLAGMQARRGRWLRPLLGFTRSELREYLQARRLEWWEDPANGDSRHLRSWLREEVIPALSGRIPDVTRQLIGAGRQAAASRAAWCEVVAHLADLTVARDHRSISVAAPVLRGYRSPLRHAVLAQLGRETGVILGTRRLAQLDRLLGAPSGCGRASLSGGHEAELAFERLTLYRISAEPCDELALGPDMPVSLGRATLGVTTGSVAMPASRSSWSTSIPPGGYVVRMWRPGDRVRPLGGRGSRSVAVLLREARVEPSRRSGWPVVLSTANATIVWVPGICRSAAGLPAEGDRGLACRLCFHLS